VRDQTSFITPDRESKVEAKNFKVVNAHTYNTAYNSEKRQ